MFGHPVVSNSLWPHGLQQARPPCPSPSPGVCPSSCSLHRWCCPAISSSDALFSFCPQSFPASGTFPTTIRNPWNKLSSASAGFFFNIGKFNFMCTVALFKIHVSWDSQELIVLETGLTFFNISISASGVYIKVWIEWFLRESIILSCLCFRIHGLAFFFF